MNGIIIILSVAHFHNPNAQLIAKSKSSAHQNIIFYIDFVIFKLELQFLGYFLNNVIVLNVTHFHSPNLQLIVKQKSSAHRSVKISEKI